MEPLFGRVIWTNRKAQGPNSQLQVGKVRQGRTHQRLTTPERQRASFSSSRGSLLDLLKPLDMVGSPRHSATTAVLQQ